MDDYQCLGCFEMFKGDSLPAVNHHLDVCPKCRADLARVGELVSRLEGAERGILAMSARIAELERGRKEPND